MSSLDYLDLCRLCLVKDRVSVPIFDGEGDVRQIFLKIAACLPVKVAREDKLPKKICDDCVYKVELFYQFWNTTANAEKQLLQWLGEVNLEDKQGYVTDVLNTDTMKDEQSTENRLDGNVIQHVGEHQNNMGMGMMDNMGLGIPIIISSANQQQITSVPMDTSGSSVQTVQAVPGPSSQTTHNQISQNRTSSTHQEDEEDTEDEENSDEECDGDDGLTVKEESEEEPSNRTVEPTTFVNVPLACDEAGPSGLQQQKISDIPELPMPQSADEDPKSEDAGVKSLTAVGHNIPTCDICKRKFTKMSSLKRHILTIHKDGQTRSSYVADFKKPYVCYICDKRYSQKYTLEKHQRSHIPNKPVTTVPPSSEAPKYAFSCAICVFSSQKRSTLITHLLEHDEALKAKKPEPPGPEKPKTKRKRNPPIRGSFPCKICGLICSLKDTLRTHFIRKHTASYDHTCPQCGRKFKLKGDLTHHTKLKHRPTRVQCHICNVTCKHKRGLYRHLYNIHYQKEYECHICKRKLATEENLNEHVARHEKKEKFICDMCGQTCADLFELRTHVRSHVGVRPYACPVCSRRFGKYSGLSQHLLLHLDKKIYECDICGKEHAQKSGLIRHRKSHGDVPPLPPKPIDHILKKFIDSVQ